MRKKKSMFRLTDLEKYSHIDLNARESDLDALDVDGDALGVDWDALNGDLDALGVDDDLDALDVDVVLEDEHEFYGLPDAKDVDDHVNNVELAMELLGYTVAVDDEQTMTRRLSEAATRILKEWFNNHIEHPYPDADEKQTLADLTGFTLKQINYWFVNYRKRHWDNRPVKHNPNPILEKWFNDHIQHPFPSTKEKLTLAILSNLTLPQINDWFTNYRKRKWYPPEVSSGGTCSSGRASKRPKRKSSND